MQNNFEQHIREKLLGISEMPAETVWPKIEENLIENGAFEININQKLDGHSISNTNAEIWHNIEKELQKKKKKKLLIWVFCITTGVIASISGMYQYLNYSKTNTIDSALPLAQTATVSESLPQKTGLKAIKKSAQQHKVTEEKSAGIGSIIELTKTYNKSKRTIQGKKHDYRQTTINSSGIEIANNTNESTNKVVKENGSQNQINALDSTVAQVEIVKEMLPTDRKVQEIKKDSNGLLNFANSEKYSKLTDKKTGNWALVIGFGTSYTGMQLFSNSNQNNLTELATRKQIEKPFMDWNANLLLEYKIAKRWTLSSGINISHFRQQLNFNKQPAQTTAQHSQPASSYLFVNDTLFSGSNYSGVNTYTFNEFPIWLNYSIKENAHYCLDVQFGYALGLLYHVDAYLLDPSGVGLLIANNVETFPKFKEAHFIKIAPGITYKVNQRNEFGFQFNCKAALNSIIAENNWVQQRPYAFGLELRYRRRF